MKLDPQGSSWVTGTRAGREIVNRVNEVLFSSHARVILPKYLHTRHARFNQGFNGPTLYIGTQCQ
jgi:hypothetical protein